MLSVIKTKVEPFLVEMGGMFSFVGSQYPLDVNVEVPGRIGSCVALHAGRTMRVNAAAHPLMVRNPQALKLVRDALVARRKEINPSPTKETSRPSI
jgi:hypothetical protein